MTLTDSPTEYLDTRTTYIDPRTEPIDLRTTRIDIPTQYIPRHRPAPNPGLGNPRSDAHLWHRLVIALGVALIGVLHLVNVNGWPVFFDDEGTYVAQAWAVYQGQLAHYTYWYDHPPAGWLQLAALMGLPDLFGVSPAVTVARFIMVGYTLTTAALLYGVCRNLRMHRWTALAAMLIWGLCPLVVYEGRQIMLDNLALPWLLGAFLLATARRRTLWQHLAAGALLGVAMLTKETTVLLAPALYLAVWTTSYRPTRAFSMVGVTMTSALTGGIYLLFAALKNELLAGPGHVSLQDAVAFQLLSRTGSGNVLEPTSIAREVLDSWLAHDSALLVAGVVAGLGCVFVRRLRPIGVALAVMLVVALRPNGYMPLMYVIAFLPFAAIAAAGMAEHALLAAYKLRLKGVPVAAALIGMILLASSAAVAPIWWQRNTIAATVDANSSYQAALTYATTRLPRHTRILADDAYWNGLVNAGWSANGWDGAIWFYKLDLDPVARDQHLPHGWRDINYIIVNADMLSSLTGQDPPSQLTQAYLHSTPIQKWGTGEQAVELRRITPTGPMSSAAAS